MAITRMMARADDRPLTPAVRLHTDSAKKYCYLCSTRSGNFQKTHRLSIIAVCTHEVAGPGVIQPRSFCGISSPQIVDNYAYYMLLSP